MIDFNNGPAAGVQLELRRSPFFLRVVRSKTGAWDALDQPDDAPKPGEAIYVYVLDKKPFGGFVRSSRKELGGRFMHATYTWHRLPADDAALRDNAKWRRWCEEEWAAWGEKRYGELESGLARRTNG